MKDPTPVEIATVAAPIYAAMNPARASMADAVNAARKLIEEAAKPAALVMTNRLLDSEKAAKQIGYVSRNWRNQFRKLCVCQWPRIAASLGGFSVAYRDGSDFFDAYNARGWDENTLNRVMAAKEAALTESRKRPKLVKGKSRGK